MNVVEYAIGPQSVAVDSIAKGQTDQELSVDARRRGNAIHQLGAVAGLCNAAEFDAATSQLPLEDRRIYGDATDQAILRFSERVGSTQKLRQCWQQTCDLAFNSKSKFMIRTFSLVLKEGLQQTLSQAESENFGPGDW